jgi:hypothetical protein
MVIRLTFSRSGFIQCSLPGQHSVDSLHRYERPELSTLIKHTITLQAIEGLFGIATGVELSSGCRISLRPSGFTRHLAVPATSTAPFARVVRNFPQRRLRSAAIIRLSNLRNTSPAFPSKEVCMVLLIIYVVENS